MDSNPHFTTDPTPSPPWHLNFSSPWFCLLQTPPTPLGVTKVHMRGQGLWELVWTWGPYNMDLCRSPHIAMKLSPREQQFCLSGGQRSENRGQKAAQTTAEEAI